MNSQSIENKLKKKYPNMYFKDMSPVDILDSIPNSVKVGKTPMNVKDLYILDIQTFICPIFCKQFYLVWPRFCRLNKPRNVNFTHLIVLDGFSSYIWSECLIKYSESKKFKKYYELLMGKLDKNLKFINPTFYGLSWKTELFEIPYAFLNKKYNILSALENGDDMTPKLKRKAKPELNREEDYLTLIRKRFKLDLQQENIEENKHRLDAFPRTELLMSLDQMVKERIPLASAQNPRWAHYKYSIPSGYKNVSTSSPMFALDCEMVECHDSATDRCFKSLASISIVNEQRETVYQTFVKPSKLIVNYLTCYSGITPTIMENTTRTLADVQQDIARILPEDAILVGHSICNDLEALEMFHPYLIDTSVIYNLKCIRYMKPKLKVLSHVFLDREIQNDRGAGHDSHEDAIATMDLVLLKLSKNLEFGDVTCGIASKSEEKEEEKEEVVIETQTNTTDLPALTDNSVHLRHKKQLMELYKSCKSVNLMKFVDRFEISNVGSVDKDLDESSDSWFPETLLKSADELEATKEDLNDSVANKDSCHSLKISEISCHNLDKEALPSKKWMSALLKKIVTEFDSLPQNSLLGLLIVDGPYQKDHMNSEFGKAYFGYTPMVVPVTENPKQDS